MKFAGLVLAFLYIAHTVSAQAANLVSTGALNTDAFPKMTTYLEVRDEGGRFVSGLKAGEVTILEDEKTLAVDELTALTPGVQWVVAINPSTAFAPRDSQGKSRYDDVAAALVAWAVSNTSQTDDLSLLMNGMENVTHLTNPMAWADAVAAAPSDHRNATSNLQLLAQAISLAAASPVREGMGRAVLFITPNPEQNEVATLESLGQQAQDSGVRLFVWMVTSEAYFTTQPAVALQQIAFSTGGQFFAYSGTEPIPDPETYLEPLRHIYALSYSSKLTSQGEHTFAVEINTPTFSATSPASTFNLDVLPPNPILVSPPGDLYRSALTDARTNQLTGYTNDSQNLDILIEFPDGFERPLVRTTLYINGKIADENTAAPFDHFTWDLSQITESGKFELQVEAVDTLGLSSISLPNTVDVTVQTLPQGFAAEISRQGSVVSAVVVLLSGAVLIFVMVMVMRRRHNPTQTGQWKKRKPRKLGKKEVKAPKSDDAQRKLPGWAQIPWPHPQARGRAPEPVAYLERVYDPNSLEASTPTQPIPILNNVVTLGADPTKATLILEEPSIAPQHARLRRDREGNFFVLDHNTVAGTWINFTQANGKEIRIEHGDLIHLGRVGFRFRMKNPPKAYEPVIEFEAEK